MEAEGKAIVYNWVCTYCGYFHRGREPPKECPQCFAGKDEFREEG